MSEATGSANYARSKLILNSVDEIALSFFGQRIRSDVSPLGVGNLEASDDRPQICMGTEPRAEVLKWPIRRTGIGRK